MIDIDQTSGVSLPARYEEIWDAPFDRCHACAAFEDRAAHGARDDLRLDFVVATR